MSTLTNASQTPANPTGHGTGEAPADIPRDRWGRPLIVPAAGGTPRAYTRASTLGGTLEDQYGLGEWRKRVVVLGMGRRRDLWLRAQSVQTWDAHQDKKDLAEIAEAAMEAAEASAAATIGTALHAMTERIDAGEPIPDIGEDRYALEAYAELASGFTMHALEQFTACDEVETAGTFDRLVSPKGVMTAPDGTRITPDDRLIDDLKGLALDTPIPTPDGWTTMGAIQAGDVVFGSDGRPCTVTAKSETKRIGTYVVEFDGGERIVCDREHLWWVMTGRGERSGLREQVLDVETLRDALGGKQRYQRVPVARALDLPAADLPIDPYLLGCWLGDGTARTGEITKDPELFDLLAADGHELGVVMSTTSDKVVTRTVLGLVTKLRAAGLHGVKHIPDAYLRGSIEQRVALLRGLLDTDGTYTGGSNQQASFSSTDKALADQVRELCLTLGLKPTTAVGVSRGYGVESAKYTVKFSPVGFMPFRLPRKVAAMEQRTQATYRARYRVVRSVEPGPDVETACIAVDSPNRTYLCGRDMIPTHNTSSTSDYFGLKFAVQLAVYAHAEPYNPPGVRPGWPDGIAPNQSWGLIMHVPSGGSSASLHWVDLRAGWEAARLACTVRDWRKRKDLVVPAERPSVPMDQALNGAGLRSLIEHAADRQACKALWVQHKSMWSAEHTALVTARFPA